MDVSLNEGTSSSPQIATSGSNIYIVWQDASSGNDDILFAASTDDGASFSEPVNVSANEGTSSSPQIATSGSNIYIVWQDSSSGNDDILFAASTNEGGAFGEVLNISNNTGTSLTSQIATSGSNIYIVWQDDESGDFDILFAASTDNGASFSEPVNVSANDGFSVTPRLVSFDDSVYLVWSDDTDVSSGFDILFAASTDNGASFSEPVNVSANDGISTSPLITVSGSGGSIYALWSDNELDESNDEIYLSASIDEGSTFGCPINLSGNSGTSSSPQMTLANDGSSLHTTWQDLTTGNFEILAASDLDPLSEVIVLNPSFTTSPKWDVDEVEVSGRVANAAIGDTVTVEWGDGTTTEDVLISSCSWGPVSHTYASSAVDLNPNMLVAKLIAQDDAEKASSIENEINVQKHSTDLEVNPIASVKQGNDVTVTGSLVDLDAANDPLSDVNISFVGSGASNLSAVSTDIDGHFSSSGPSINSTEDGLEVQAHFEGTLIYEEADSETRTYDTAELLALEFDVAAGSNVTIALTDTNATVEFEEITTGGKLFVSACDDPDSDKLIALDNSCLRISPGFQMAAGSSALVNMSFAGFEIPDGYSPNDVALFHEINTSEGSTIVDVTSSKNTLSGTVTGTISSFSNFFLGVALHDEVVLGHYRTQIFVGDGNVVAFRDVTNQVNSSLTAKASLDKTKYKMTDDPIVTIDDSNGNVDPTQLDVVYAGLMSETSDPFAIGVRLQETGDDTGKFTGSFSFTRGESSTEDGVLQTRTGEQLSIFYVSGARFEASISGVIESGEVDLSDYVVEEGVCFNPIGGAIDLQFVDATIGEDGKIRATLSYANALLEGNDPSLLRMMHKEESTWIDVTLDTDGINTDTKTVTGEATTAGPFSLATNVGDCGGGAGGGAGFGRGLVVDFVASLANTGGGGGGTGSVSDQAASGQSTVSSGQDVSSATNVGSETVTVTFETIRSSDGPLMIKLVDLSDLQQYFEEIKVEHDREQGLLTFDGRTYSTAGSMFEIDTSTINFEGGMDVTIPYGEDIATASGSESNIRFLHFDPDDNEWHDETVAIDMSANTVTGRMNTLSPVIAAVVNDGTFEEKYFEFNPMSKIVDVGTPDWISLVDSNGIKLSSVTLGEEVEILSTLKNLQRAAQSYQYVIEVLDNEGVAVDIIIKAETLDAGETAAIKSGWTPSSAGTFTFRVFAIGELDSPSPVILKDISTAKFEVN